MGSCIGSPILVNTNAGITGHRRTLAEPETELRSMKSCQSRRCICENRFFEFLRRRLAHLASRFHPRHFTSKTACRPVAV
jgi:hypothetical protein